MTAAGVRAAFPWLGVVALLVGALSLRSPIVAPTPVIGDISRDFGLDAASAGLITTAPVLMFALMTPFAALLIRRAGSETAFMVTLLGVVAGSLIRMLPGFGWLLAGMFVIGAAITVGNVVAPVIIRREVPPERVATVTAAYTATLNLGSLLASLATAPLAAALGWQSALLVWAALTAAGVLVWSWHMRRDRVRSSATVQSTVQSGADAVSVITGPTPVVTRTARTTGGRGLWAVTVCLLLAFGMQSATYYSLTTWLPTIAADVTGTDAAGAGALASVFQGVAIVGAFLVPALNRVVAPVVTAAVIAACWLTTTVGLAAAPQLMLLWICVGGVAQAGGFVVVFATLAQAARSDAEAATMSAAVQGGGYVLASAGPPVVGLVHEVVGGWTAALGVLVGTTGVFTVALLAATVLLRRRR